MSKKQRTIVRVDEDKIKRMIAGDEPFLQEVLPATEKIPEQEVETIKHDYPDEITDKERSSGYQSQRRKSKTGYTDIFLCKDRESEKKQTTLLLSASIFDKMEVLLSATKGLSMAMFVSNVLLHHFEEYEKDINAIKAKYIEKLSKKCSMKIIILTLSASLLEAVNWGNKICLLLKWQSFVFFFVSDMLRIHFAIIKKEFLS